MKNTLTTGEIADRLNAQLDGDAQRPIQGVSGLREAGPTDISFLANLRYAADAEKTQAGAVLVTKNWNRPCPATLIRVDGPDTAFAHVVEWFAPKIPSPEPGIHPTALVASDAVLGSNISVGPYTVVESGVTLGDRVVLGAHGYVGHGCRLGADTRLYSQVSLREFVTLGNRVIIHSGAVLGSDGFGYNVDKNGIRSKIPQYGTVEVGDDVEIGANVTVDRARFGRTFIGCGVKIDNLVQIAHNVHIGEHAVIVAQVGISGSTRIGSRAVLAGQAGIVGHIVVGEGAIVGAQAGVTKSVPPRTFVSGYPAAPHQRAMRIQACLARLPEWRDQLSALEKRLTKIETSRSNR